MRFEHKILVCSFDTADGKSAVKTKRKNRKRRKDAVLSSSVDFHQGGALRWLLETSCKVFHTAEARNARILSSCCQTCGSVFVWVARGIKCNGSVP